MFCPGKNGLKIRDELGISERSCVIGVVGRLDPIKDHSTLFQAFAEVRKASPDARLLVVGDGPERAYLEDLAGDGILFLGNRLDVPVILQALDIFVLSSLNEGISNTILEAMATGLPVIATKVGGNSELVEDGATGILVPPKEPKAIASALLKYIRNPEIRNSHGNRGRINAIQVFSIENMVKGYVTVYKRAVSTSLQV